MKLVVWTGKLMFAVPCVNDRIGPRTDIDGCSKTRAADFAAELLYVSQVGPRRLIKLCVNRLAKLTPYRRPKLMMWTTPAPAVARGARGV